MSRFSQTEVSAELHKHPDWSATGEAIQRTYQFRDFLEAMAFVNKVAAVAEADQHHPDILIRWNKVTLTLSTHDAGGVTGKDFASATKSDALSGLPPTSHAQGELPALPKRQASTKKS